MGTDGAPGADGAPGTDGADGTDGAPGAEGIDDAPATDGAPIGEPVAVGDAIMEEPIFCIIWPAAFWPACFAAPSAAEPIPPAAPCACVGRSMHAKMSATASPAKVCTFMITPPRVRDSDAETKCADMRTFHIDDFASNVGRLAYEFVGRILLNPPNF